MKFLVVFYLMGIFALACNREEKCIDESNSDPDAVCMQVYDPVCGCNEVTYSNSCEAEKAGVTRWQAGECP